MNEVQETSRSVNMMGEKNPTKRDEVRAKISKALRKAWANPNIKAKISGDNNPTKRAEVREKISNSLKKTWGDPVRREAIRAKIAETVRVRREAKIQENQSNS